MGNFRNNEEFILIKVTMDVGTDEEVQVKTDEKVQVGTDEEV
jgi:hypothetical protein